MTSHCAQNFKGPSQQELMTLLRTADALKSLPILLGVGAPRAIVAFEEDSWTLRQLAVPDAMTNTATRFLGGLIPGEIVLRAANGPALANAVAAMDWSYGPEFPSLQLTVDVCPQAEVEHADLQLALLGTGTVLYVGRAHVAVIGRKIGHATSQQVQAVLALLDSQEFKSFAQSNEAAAEAESPGLVKINIDLQRDGQQSKLSCSLDEQSAPVLRQLWLQLQTVARTQGWLA